MFKWANLFGKHEIERDIISPNGRIRCHFELKSGMINYSVYQNDKLILKPSNLGFLICGEKPLGVNLKLIREQKKKHEENIELPWGEDRLIKNHYVESAFYLAEDNDEGRILTLRFRVFDNAVAFRYEFRPNLNLVKYLFKMSSPNLMSI